MNAVQLKGLIDSLLSPPTLILREQLMNLRGMTTLFALSLCATLSLAGKTQATLLSFHANLDGLQEVPPNASPAVGLADLTLDDSTGVVTITSGSYTGLIGTAAQKIILFDGPPGVNGSLVFLFTNDTPGATTGTFSGGSLLSPTQIADMVAGNTYININNLTFTLGEIRGQLLPVPEPSTLSLGAIGGLCGLLVAGRRTRRKVA